MSDIRYFILLAAIAVIVSLLVANFLPIEDADTRRNTGGAIFVFIFVLFARRSKLRKPGEFAFQLLLSFLAATAMFLIYRIIDLL